MAKVVHYREKCIGCNSCVEHAPAHWTLSAADGKSCLVGSKKKKNVFIKEIDPSDIPALELSAKDCPVRIIKVEK